MTRRTIRPALAIVLGAALLAAVPRARAQVPSPDKDLSIYVSDKFKKVAKRVLRQYAVQRIAESCPDDQPLCGPLVDALARGVEAAVDGDLAKVKEVVSGLFVDATVTGLLHYALNDLLAARLPPADQQLVRSLARCLVKVITQKRFDRRCLEGVGFDVLARLGVEPATAAAALRLVEAVKRGQAPVRSDLEAFRLDDASPRDDAAEADARLIAACATAVSAKRDAGRCVDEVTRAVVLRLPRSRLLDGGGAIRRVLSGLTEARVPSASDVVTVLAAIAHANARTDIAAFLDGVAQVVSRGLEQGLFPAVHGALRDDFFLYVALEPIFAGAATGGGHILFNPSQDEDYLAAIAAAKALAPAQAEAYDRWTRAYQDWRAARAAYAAALRRHLVLREAIDVGLLQSIVVAARAVSPLPKDLPVAMRKLIDQQQRLIGALVGALQLQGFVNRYGTVILAAAAIIDYARTGSKTRFTEAVKQTILFATARLLLRARGAQELAKDPAKLTYRVVTEPDAYCEQQELAELLEAPLPGRSDAADCYTVIEGKSRPRAKVPSAQEPGARARFVAERLKGLAPKLIETAGQPIQEARDRARRAGIPMDELEHAIGYLVDNDVDSALKTLARLGITLIMEHLDKVLLELLAAPGGCAGEVGRTSILYSMGARCAVYVLIQSAYDGVADYLWDVGSRGDPQVVAESLYRRVAASNTLDSVPLVLNVGLGVSHVFGREGSDNFTALTLLDKLGVALYKEFAPRDVFEIGLFAGGFLDAIVRTVAEEGEADRVWLLGVNVGWTRLCGLDLGIELHAAAALPFTLDGEAGWAVGAAVVVPFTIVFGEED